MVELESKNSVEKLGTSISNKKTPIHRWFPFYAGFSAAIVEETINYFLNGSNNLTFDPFMGSGTTGVSCQKLGVDVIGNEINPFLNRICRAKLRDHMNTDLSEFKLTASTLLKQSSLEWKSVDLSKENKVLNRIYPIENLKKLVHIRNQIEETVKKEYKDYFFLVLSKCLISCAQVGINVPYISWKAEKEPKEVFTAFEAIFKLIYKDIEDFKLVSKLDPHSDIFLHDSRKLNQSIQPNSVNLVFSSPPYLNNFDYGEALKVFLYFWKYANNWEEINTKIRKPSVVSATTHYNDSEYSVKLYEDILGKEFMDDCPLTSPDLINKAQLIKKEMEKRNATRKKTFDILTLLYFKDMELVLKEIKRIMQKNALCFFVIGDSAPYGIHILTDAILGEISLQLGYSDFTLHPLRQRGLKWKSLRYRHKLILRESLLVIRR